MEEKKTIIYIGTEHIHAHPQNPRKNLGDLSELSDSIKKNGVLQNLTVVPIEGQPGEYYALIGNRRHEAAAQAGVKELPCRIVEGMTEREQLSTMLEENMQRDDLTVYEQAQGFQLMLDLGETEDSIAEKTGFAKQTIRHRLNIAKLNQSELLKKEKDESFQLTLRDLYELEKIKNLSTRNKILKEASTSRDLATRARGAYLDQTRDENAKKFKKVLQKLGIKDAPKEYDPWNGKWKTLGEYSLTEEIPKQINLPEDVPASEMFYHVGYRDVKIVMKAPKNEKRELSKWEIEQKEKDSKKRKIKAVFRESTARRKDFISDIISGKIDPVKDEDKEKDIVWAALSAMGAYVNERALIQFFLKKDIYQSEQTEVEAAREKVGTLSTLHQMLIILHTVMATQNEPFSYDIVYLPDRAKPLMKGYEALEPYGWYFEREEEQQVIDGTYELYAKEKKK